MNAALSSPFAPLDPAAAPDDAALVLSAQGGDRGALDMLVRRHHPEVARLMWRFARRHADLEDLMQEVFIRLVRALPGWRPDRPFLHWLRRIAVNTGRDHCRREAVASGTDPAARLAADEAKALLARLPPDDRTLLTLHYLEGWEFARIGELLGWSGPVTKPRLPRPAPPPIPAQASRFAMKPSPEPSEAQWAQLAARARADSPPPTDLAAVLQAARTEAAALFTAVPRTWLDEFAVLFATPRRLASCGGVAGMALAAAIWFGMSTWTQLEPWAGLVWSALEGNG